MGLIITLVVIGLILIFAEIFLLPGIGVAGILGVLSMGGSCYLAFSNYGLTGCVIVTIVNVVLLATLIIAAFRAKTWKKLSLDAQIESKATGKEKENIKVGDTGSTMTRLAPSGTVLFATEKVEARAFEGMIDPGVDVEVVLIEDEKIYVKQK